MEKQRAKEVLRNTQETEKIVCLYCNPHSDSFAAGFVETISNDHVVLRHLTAHGCYDGWVLRALEDICRIEYGGRYEEKLLSLFQARKQSHPHFLPRTDESTDLIYEMLLKAQQKDWGVIIDTGADRDIWGFVKSIDATTMTVEKFNDEGQLDSECVIELEYVERLTVDDDDMQDLKILAHWRNL